jgi:RecJ-like exonuclease
MKVDNVTPHYPHRKSDPQFVRRFVENTAICWNCNGDGKTDRLSYCRVCDGKGVQPWVEFKKDVHEADMIELGVFYTYCIKNLKY